MLEDRYGEYEVSDQNLFMSIYLSVFTDAGEEMDTDAAYTYAVVTWGQPGQTTVWVALSSSCWALIAEDRLKGFFVHLQ